MANEIVALEGDGSNTFQILFLYPVASPASNGGVQVSPSNSAFLSPSADLPPSAQERLTPAELTAIDSGDVGWEIISFTKQPGLTNPQQSQMLQEMYNGSAEGIGRLQQFLDRYNNVYLHIGVRITP